MRLISRHFMGGLRAQLSLALMGVACINLTLRKVSEKTTLLLFLTGFLAQHSVPSVRGRLCGVTVCLALKLLTFFIYMEMDRKQGSELTCLITTYLCHHLASTDIQLVQPV